MAVTNGYVTVNDAKSALGVDLDDPDDDAQLERSINTASRLIDDYCGQRFWQDPSDTTRYFTPKNPRTLWLRSCSNDPQAATVTSVTSVTIDTTGDGTFDITWTEGTDYCLSPRGAAASSEPYRKLEALTGASTLLPPGRRDAVKIVGTFGWAAVPDRVAEACLIQTQVLFKRATEGAAPIVTMDGVTLPSSKYLDLQVQLLLAKYRPVVVA